VGHHLPPGRMFTVKNQKIHVLLMIWKNWNPCAWLKVCKMVLLLWKTV
jgi:hypothetical protein